MLTTFSSSNVYYSNSPCASSNPPFTLNAIFPINEKSEALSLIKEKAKYNTTRSFQFENQIVYDIAWTNTLIY